MSSSKPGGFLDAAATVLAGSVEPMTVEEITAEALRRGLLKTAGKTPVATMSAQLYTHVKESANPRFVRLSEPGPTRARRNSVRWTLNPKD